MTSKKFSFLEEGCKVSVKWYDGSTITGIIEGELEPYNGFRTYLLKLDPNFHHLDEDPDGDPSVAVSVSMILSIA